MIVMDNVRVFLSTLIFVLGCYLLIFLYWDGFNFFILAGAIVSFCVAHYLLPKDRRKNDERFEFLDLLELIIDIPFSVIEFFFKFIGRLFKGKDGVDFDLDL